MKKGTLGECLKHTVHNCEMDKALLMPAVEELGRHMAADWKYRFQLVAKNLDNASVQLQKVVSAAQKSGEKIAERALSVQEHLTIVCAKAKRDYDPVPPAVHLTDLRGDVQVAWERLNFLEETAHDMKCQPVLDALAEKVVEFGH